MSPDPRDDRERRRARARARMRAGTSSGMAAAAPEAEDPGFFTGAGRALARAGVGIAQGAYNVASVVNPLGHRAAAESARRLGEVGARIPRTPSVERTAEEIAAAEVETVRRRSPFSFSDSPSIRQREPLRDEPRGYTGAVLREAVKDPGGVGRYLAERVVESAPQTAAVLAASAVHPALGAGVAATLETGAQYNEATTDPETGEYRPLTPRAALAGAVSGTASGAFESFAATRLLGRASRAMRAAGLPAAARRSALREIAQATAGQTGEEAGTEAIQTVLTNVGARYGWQPDRNILEGVGEAALVGGVAGGIFGGAGSIAGQVAGRATPAVQPTAEAGARVVEEALAEDDEALDAAFNAYAAPAPAAPPPVPTQPEAAPEVTGLRAGLGAMGRGISEGYADSAWERLSQGQRLLYTRPGSVEEAIETAYDAGQVSGPEDIAPIIAAHYAAPTPPAPVAAPDIALPPVPEPVAPGAEAAAPVPGAMGEEELAAEWDRMAAAAPVATAPAADLAAPPAPSPAETEAEPARSVVINVDGEERSARLTGERLAEYEAAEAQYARRRELVETGNWDRETKQKQLKAAAMEHAAERRRITGLLTAKEQANAERESQKMKAGREVVVTLPDGREMSGSVLSTPFGRVRVRTEEGDVTVERARVRFTETAPAAPVEAVSEETADINARPEPVAAPVQHGAATLPPERVPGRDEETGKFLRAPVRDAEGRVMAPNEQPSRLGEGLWQRVRMPEFQTRFGDWESDPENASKVIDENGEPLVVYHGTAADFEEFLPEQRGTSTKAADAREGFFFTSSPEVADEFTWARGDKTGSIRPAFLALRNPLVTDFQVTAANTREFAALLRRAREEGHDGVAAFGEFLGKEAPVYVAFEASQIIPAYSDRTFNEAKTLGATDEQAAAAVNAPAETAERLGPLVEALEAQEAGEGPSVDDVEAVIQELTGGTPAEEVPAGDGADVAPPTIAPAPGQAADNVPETSDNVRNLSSPAETRETRPDSPGVSQTPEGPRVGESGLDPETYRITKAELGRARERLGLNALEPAGRRKWTALMQEALDTGAIAAVPGRVGEVLRPEGGRPRPFSDLENVAALLHLSVLYDRYADYAAMAERLQAEGREAESAALFGRIGPLLQEIDETGRALDLSKRETARALASLRMAVTARTYELATVLAGARSAKGSPLTETERAELAQLTRENERLHRVITDRDEKNEKRRQARARVKAEAALRVAHEGEAPAAGGPQSTGQAREVRRKEILTERERILRDMAKRGMRLNDVTGLPVEALQLIARLAFNYAQELNLRLEEVVARVRETAPDLTEEEVLHAIITPGTRSEEARARTRISAKRRRDLRAAAARALQTSEEEDATTRREARRRALDVARGGAASDTRQSTAPEGERFPTLEEVIRRVQGEFPMLTEGDILDAVATPEARREQDPEALRALRVQQAVVQKKIRAAQRRLKKKSGWQMAGEVAGLFKEVAFTGDISYFGRQGLFAIGPLVIGDVARMARGKAPKFPGIVADAFRGFNMAAAERIDFEIRNDPDFYLYTAAGGELSPIGEDADTATASAREEAVMGRIFQKAPRAIRSVLGAAGGAVSGTVLLGPGVGTAVGATYGAASGAFLPEFAASFTTFMNSVRFGLFKAYLDANPTAGIETLKGVNRAAGNWTGRAKLGPMEAVAAQASFFLNSPRLYWSRFSMFWDPFRRGGSSPEARRYAMRGLASSALFIGGTLALIHLLRDDDEDADVEFNPRSSDFLKIVEGDTRTDVTAGVAQPARLLGRLALAATDAHGLTRHRRGEREITPEAEVGRYLFYRMSPALRTGYEALYLQDVMHDDLTYGDVAAHAVTPLGFVQAAEVASEGRGSSRNREQARKDALRVFLQNALGISTDVYK